MKSNKIGISRFEFEYQIPKKDAKELRKARVITKHQKFELDRAIETGNSKGQRDIVDWAKKQIFTVSQSILT